jgi:hypothetical protein
MWLRRTSNAPRATARQHLAPTTQLNNSRNAKCPNIKIGR